jgi:hypothetical protein
VERKSKKGHKIITAIICGFALIIFWRGVWGLADIYLFPENPALSASISIIIGISILYLMDSELRYL